MDFRKRADDALRAFGEKVGVGAIVVDERGYGTMELRAADDTIVIVIARDDENEMISFLTELGSLPKGDRMVHLGAALLAANLFGRQTYGVHFSMTIDPPRACLGHCVFGTQLTAAGLDEVVGRIATAAKEWRARFREIQNF